MNSRLDIKKNTEIILRELSRGRSWINIQMLETVGGSVGQINFGPSTIEANTGVEASEFICHAAKTL
jgi:hypothetical protein